MRFSKSLIVLVLLSLIALAAEGAVIDDFTLKNLRGEDVVLSEFCAEGPIILTFWATWCKPCIKELRKLTVMKNFLDAHGLRVMAVCEDGPRTRNKVRPFADKENWEFTIVMDKGGRVKTQLGVADIPELFILTTEREILYHHIGYKPGDEAEYKKTIEELFPIEDEPETAGEDEIAE